MKKMSLRHFIFIKHKYFLVILKKIDILKKMGYILTMRAFTKNCLKIGVKLTNHTIDHFKVANSASFSTHTMLYLYLLPKHIRQHKRKPRPIEQLLTFFLPLRPWKPPLCVVSMESPILEISYK